MDQITCPKCNTRENTSGFGFAAGPMGAYTFCNHCDALLEFTPDSSFGELETKHLNNNLDKHMLKTFGAENWNGETHRLIDKWYNQGA